MIQSTMVGETISLVLVWYNNKQAIMYPKNKLPLSPRNIFILDDFAKLNQINGIKLPAKAKDIILRFKSVNNISIILIYGTVYLYNIILHIIIIL